MSESRPQNRLTIFALFTALALRAKAVLFQMDSIGLIGSLLTGGNYTLMKIITTSLNHRMADNTLNAGGNFTFAYINGIYAVSNSDGVLPVIFNIIMAPNCDTSYTGIPSDNNNYVRFKSTATSIIIDSENAEAITEGSMCTIAFFK